MHRYLAQAQKTSEDVNQVKENLEPLHPQKGKLRNGKNGKNDKSQKSCLFCGGIHPFEKGKCPAWGHKSVDDNEDINYIAGIAVECSVEPSDNSHLPKIFSEMPIDDKPIKFQVDCGSLINILPKEVIGDSNLAPTSKTLIMWNKTEVMPLGTTRIIVTNPQNRKKYSVEFVIVTEKLTPLVGARAAQHMKLLTIHWNNFKSVPTPKRNDAVVHHYYRQCSRLSCNTQGSSSANLDVSQAW